MLEDKTIRPQKKHYITKCTKCLTPFLREVYEDAVMEHKICRDCKNLKYNQ